MLGLLLGICGWEIFWWGRRKHLRRVAFRSAVRRARRSGKPLLIVGVPDRKQTAVSDGYGCGAPEKGDVVLDVRDTTECPRNFQLRSVEDLGAWPDKHFGAAFVPFVLEHTCDPVRALGELRRVADAVYVVHPQPWTVFAWILPGHAWLVQRAGPQGLRFRRLRRRCNVPTRLGGDRG